MKRLCSYILSLALIASLATTAWASNYEGLGNFTAKYVCYPNQFLDVSSSSWYAENVTQVYKLGLMVGNSETTFNPNGLITEAEALTIAARIHKIYTTGNDDFSDIKQEMQEMEPTIFEWCGNDKNNPVYKEFYNAWYSPYAFYYSTYVLYQNEDNISNYNYFLLYPGLGVVPEYALDLDQNAISRKRFVEILAQTLPEKELMQINTVEDDSIPDVASSDGFEVYQFYRAGILTGANDEGSFWPDKFIERAEAAAIISRMIYPATRQSITLVNENSIGNNAGISEEMKLQYMAAVGINTAYQSAKFPSTLHLNQVTYSDEQVNGYGDTITRMAMRFYAANSAGGYGDLYVSVICCEYENDHMDFEWNGLYFSPRSYGSNPGMDNHYMTNEAAMNAYKTHVGDAKEIPYD